ncbi:hypothetical protein C496_14001 [Natronorubrum tibetense GA33]|uniref:Potassium channel domain-containing protein n=1 Tax=Natronorubrum tibetense GA33 TaxID=1114856 RepID=L9VRW7_9EURY|nr:hypothetical protein C496_14001 [Natronorubrum tibetense GA33]
MGNKIDFEKVTLRDADLSDADLREANLSGADLSDADLSGADLRKADLSGANLKKTDLAGANLFETDLSDANLFEAKLSDADLVRANLSDARVIGADLSNVDTRDADLSDANLARADLSDAYLVNTDFSGAELRATDFSGAYLPEVDLSGVNLKSATFHNANLQEVILNRATLFRVDFRGAKLHGSLLGDARIDAETEFLGPPVNDGVRSPHTCAAIFSKPCCVYDPNYSGESDETNEDKAKSVYQALEELATRAAQTRLQSQCFVRRQDIQKDVYRKTLLNGPEQDSDETETIDSQPYLQSRLNSFEIRSIAGMRYARAKTARMTLLYGESPWRIIAWSVGFVVAVALVYPLNEWLRPIGEEPITYSRIAEEPTLFLESLYFSTLTFTTLGMGDYEPLGWGQAIATLNTAFGAILIALLVFVLGRRAAK